MFMSKLSHQAISRLDYPVVQTTSGKIRGVEKEGGYIFRGIPYAQAKRFQLPMDPTPWDGVRECLVFGYDAPLYQAKIARDQHELPHYWNPQSEDCQNLNIWTQHLDSSAKKPVLIWLHGAGFGAGAAMEQLAYDGEELSRYGDIVFVSPNFRLNALGCLDLSGFGDQYADSGICGLADLVKALEWVQRNIANFGGDPDNVTLLGHAGGAPAVIALVQTPAADGLYHKISLSSGLFHPFHVPEGYTIREISRRMGELTAQQLGLTSDSIAEIEEIPYWFLTDAANRAQQILKEETDLGQYRWLPVPDQIRYYAYETPGDLRHKIDEIPILLGIDMGDASCNARVHIGDRKKNTWDEKNLWKYLRDMYGNSAEAIVSAFQEAYPGRAICDALFVDRKTRYTHFPLMEELANRGAKLWNWMFALELPINSGSTPLHCIDNAFVTHNAEFFEATYIPGVTERLQEEMCDALVHFSYFGNPQAASLPDWPAVSKDDIPTMIFDRITTLRHNHDRRLQTLMKPWRIPQV